MEEGPGESLGKATLDLEANLAPFDRSMKLGRDEAGRMENALDAVAAIAKLATDELNRVKMKPGQAAETTGAAEAIERSVGRVARTALDAADHLERVKLSAEQAAETDVAGDAIDHKLNQITGHANEARRALESVRLRIAGLGGGGGILSGGRSGVGVGPFESGYGRIGVVGAAVGVGALTAPAAAPAVAGLLAAVPTLAAAGAGALGTLALAFSGVGKAIGGDLKAFKELEPAQQQFVLTVRSLDGWLDKLKQTAGSALFPGLTAGLKSALSPGTLGAITTAVKEFGTAIGNAGAQWGRYFGSTEFQSIFTPLMQSGARNLGKLADTALRLFDAFGVLGRAAIPLVNWLTDLADKGSRMLDTWLHAKDATGGLSRAMDEAKSSLRLVGGLIVSLGRVVGALGKALYPVAKVAVKDLTDGLNALAGIISRNQGTIRTLVGGALHALVDVVKIAAGALRLLTAGMRTFIGNKAPMVTAILAIGAALTFAIGPEAIAVVGAIAAATLIYDHWKQLGTLMSGAINAAWTAIKGIFDLGVYAVLVEISLLAKGVEKAFGWVPFIGGRVKSALDNVETYIDGFRRRGIAELGNAGSQMGDAWGSAFNKSASTYLSAQVQQVQHYFGPGAAAGYGGKNSLAHPIGYGQKNAPTGPIAPPDVVPPPLPFPNFTPTPDTTSPFGTPPPFDKNVPKPKKPKAPPLLPALAAHAEALASANANRASLLHNTGKTAQRYLQAELADLETADKAIKAKYATATGRIRTELFTAITGVENKMRTVRERIASAIKDSRAAELQFAVDNAKAAVAAATAGTAAYDKAVKAEEKALRAQIKYLNALAHNSKLSFAIRSRYLREETADEKQLAALLSPAKAAAAGANESQFLAAFAQIVQSYAPNSFPQGEPKQSGQTDTHLYDIKDETRKQTRLLDKIAGRSSFPASGYMGASAAAVTG